METVIESYLNDFCDHFGMKDMDASTKFEDFVNYVSIPKLEENSESIEGVNIGNNGNPGIDGLAIIVNDHIVHSTEEVDYFLNALGRLEVSFYFVQAKTSSSFEMTEMVSFINCIKDFFKARTTFDFNDDTIRLHEVKEYIYSKSIKMLQNPTLTIIYGCLGQWSNDNKNFEAAINTVLDELKSTGYFSNVEFKPYDRDLLKSSYRELRNTISRSIVFEKHTIIPSINDVDEAFVGMLPGSEYLKLISSEQGDMLRNIFYDNVRDFQGFNSVNSEIKNTLEDNDSKDKFALLNNGITIVAKKINKTGYTFNISDYQIVNGCQTSHVLFYNRKYIDDKVYIPIKLIVTKNYELMSKIIRANNRQTTVGNEAFEILSPFHKYLEEFYIAESKKHSIDLFYERRSNQYDHDNLTRSSYVTLASQIKSLVAMFFYEPHCSTQRYFGELLQMYTKNVFKEGDLGFPYYASGLALNRIEKLFAEGKIEKKYKRFKFHIIMLIKTLIIGAEKDPLNKKKLEQDCEKLISMLLDETVLLDYVHKAISMIDERLNNVSHSYFRNAHGTSAFTDSILPEKKSKKTKGTVSYYNDDRGFGYLDVKAPQDIFFHIYDYHINNSDIPQIGDELLFDVVDTEKGLRALNISKF